MRIKTGDNVVIITGKDRKKPAAKVVATKPSAGKVIVEGRNMVKKHVR